MADLTMPAGDPIADLSKAPLPTQKTLKARRNLFLQFLRFVAFDLRIMRMVVKGHH
ncbi:MAG: hypothetical protein WAL91_07895 [Propionicimonas sp.]